VSTKPAAAQWAALDAVPDTGSTTVGNQANPKETSEKLDPPFRPDKEPLIDAALLMRFMKVGGAVAMFFITIVLPAVWYLSKLDSTVDVLQANVTEIKQKTDGLVRESVLFGGRLDALEKSINNTVVYERPSTRRESSNETAAK
jgi:hypothetical protein